MNNFDEWSQIISKFLKAEADLLTSVTKHEISADSTRAAFIRGVLEPFLPSSYAIGSGRIIDSAGNSSKHIDIVIYRRDFPRLNLPGSADVFLYESVLATIEVRTKLIRKTLFDALDSCASIAELIPGIDGKIIKNIATQNKMTLNDENKYVHEYPLLTDRFNLIGRPPSFIYGFNGFQTSPKQLNDNIEIWIESRNKNNLDIDLKSFPAVIATQGCIGWRNAAPLSANSNHLFGIGADSAPIRLIVFHLLYQLNKRLRATPDGYGLKPSVDAYLDQMAPPDILHAIGKPTHKAKSVAKEEKTGSIDAKVSAPRITKSPVTKPQVSAESKPAIETKPVTEARPAPEQTPFNQPKPAPEAKVVSQAKPAPEVKKAVESKPTPAIKTVAETKPAPAPKTAAESISAPEIKKAVEPATEVKKFVEPKPALEVKKVAESKPAPEVKKAIEPKPAPEQKPAMATRPAVKAKPTSESVSVFDTRPDLENTPPARQIPKPVPEVTAEHKASSIPKPALGAMYHPDPTLMEMPVPDAGMVPDHAPEPEPESDPFIQTMRVSDSASKSEPEPAAPAIEKQSTPEPESYVETLKTTAEKLEAAAKPEPAAETQADDDAEDPFLQTVRIPASAMPGSEPASDPFGKTIPGLQDPPKSVH
jgi:hypothetical protein